MQIASFILVSDRLLRHFEDQLELAMSQLPTPGTAFANVVPVRMRELGTEHPISIPVSSLFPLDQAAGRQHLHLFSAFEDPARPSKIGKMAEMANVPMYYVPPARVRDFVDELEDLRLTAQIHPEDVETLLGRRVSREELPAVARLLDEFRHDLYQVYRDASNAGKGVVVLVVTQPEAMTSEEGFPRAA